MSSNSWLNLDQHSPISRDDVREGDTIVHQQDSTYEEIKVEKLNRLPRSGTFYLIHRPVVEAPRAAYPAGTIGWAILPDGASVQGTYDDMGRFQYMDGKGMWWTVTTSFTFIPANPPNDLSKVK